MAPKLEDINYVSKLSSGKDFKIPAKAWVVSVGKDTYINCDTGSKLSMDKHIEARKAEYIVKSILGEEVVLDLRIGNKGFLCSEEERVEIDAEYHVADMKNIGDVKSAFSFRRNELETYLKNYSSNKIYWVPVISEIDGFWIGKMWVADVKSILDYATANNKWNPDRYGRKGVTFVYVRDLPASIWG